METDDIISSPVETPKIIGKYRLDEEIAEGTPQASLVILNSL